MENREKNKATLAELEEMKGLYARHLALREKIDTSSEKEEEESDKIISANLKVMEKTEKEEKAKVKEPPLLPRTLLLPPPEAPICEAFGTTLSKQPKNPPREKLNTYLISLPIVGLALPILLIAGILSWIVVPNKESAGLVAFNVFVWFGLLGVGLAWFCGGCRKKAIDLYDFYQKQQEWQSALVKWKTDFDREADKPVRDRFFAEFAAYDKRFTDMTVVCDNTYRTGFAAWQAERMKIYDTWEAKRKEWQAEDDRVCDELRSHTLLPEEMWEYLTAVTTNLIAGRADTMKEALNLALQDARLQAEADERREDARRQEAILERQAEENRRHNEKMQRAEEARQAAQKAHNAAMERAADAQARAAQVQASAAQAQAREAARAAETAAAQARHAETSARHRCKSCANAMKCDYRAMANAQNCAAFRPK